MTTFLYHPRALYLKVRLRRRSRPPRAARLVYVEPCIETPSFYIAFQVNRLGRRLSRTTRFITRHVILKAEVVWVRVQTVDPASGVLRDDDNAERAEARRKLATRRVLAD